jgi:DNA-binding CsgD family transcriptional regulator/tetratricopeptide (TPR) repeat protein
LISTGVVCREFIGRTLEMQFLVDRVTQVRAGHGGTVVIRGSAGIGKSRLVGEVVRASRQIGVRTVEVACSELGDTPYAPVLEIGKELDAPSVTQVLNDPGHHSGSAAAERTHRFSAAAAALATTADQAPFLAIVEDVHWATPASLDLIRHVMSALRGRPALLVFTQRDDEPIGDTKVVRLLETIAREADAVLTLEALTSKEIKSLIASALRDDGRQVTSVLAEEVAALSDGRPFYAEELLRGALDRRSGHGDSPRLRVPPTVRAVVAERLAEFDRDEMAVLAHCAVVGARVDIHFLTKLLERGGSEILPILRKARNAQLIVEEENGEAFAFRHALTREAIYDHILRAEARLLHRRIADQLIEEGADPVQIAYHAWRSGDPDLTLEWNQSCGEAAAAIHAHVDAIRHFERAFHLAAKGSTRSHVAESLARAHAAIGDHPEAVRWYGLASEDAESSDRAQFLRVLRAQLLFEGGEYAAGLRGIDAIIADVGYADTPIRFEAEVRAAGLLNTLGRPIEAHARLAALTGFTCERHPSLNAAYQGTLAASLHGLGRLEESAHAFSAAVAASRESGHLDLLERTLNNYAILKAARGDIDDAVETFREALAVARTIRAERLVAWVQQNIAYYFVLLGKFEDALASYDEAVAINHGVPSVSRWLSAVSLRIGTLTGDSSLIHLDDAERAFGQSITDGDRGSATVLAGALMLHEQMSGESGNRYAERYLQIDAIADEPWIGEAAAKLRGDLAWKIRERVAKAAEPEEARPMRATAALLDARLALRERRRQDVEPLAVTALAAFKALKWPIEEAYARELLGDVAGAVNVLRRVGAHAEVERLTTITPKVPRRRGESTLTARESEIANQIVSGKSNREVAEVLVISERTVETHVAAIYGKLGVSNRRDLVSLLSPKNG